MARPPVSAKTVSQPDHSSRGDGQREPGFGAHHPRPRPPHRRGETRTRVTRVVRAGRSSSIWDISIYFASQNALCVTPRANAAIDARFMNGDRQVRPKPTLLGKPGRSECMVRPLAGLSPRGVAHDRGHHGHCRTYGLLRSVIFFNTACRDRPGGTVSSCPLPAAPGAPARGGHRHNFC